MAKFNENYLNVKQSYLFSEIAKRVSAFEQVTQTSQLSVLVLAM